MYLKKLEIHGFKSFAKKMGFVFEPGITSIVGPNGSGKSNIADSLRWVFGEQSLKLLRGKKSEDVIFAGSDHKARLGGAEVLVYFENSDHGIPLDYTEVVIGRRLYRDGISEYLINGNQVRLLDITELLAKSGFGNTAYHVIGQGMIDQLILGGPLAIKDLLEEASGVAPYYLKREKSLRRLERTETNLDQVRALLNEIAPRLRSLKRQTKRLEQRAELEVELQDTQVLHYGQMFQGLNRQLSEIQGKLGVFEKQTAELSLEIQKFTTDIEQQEQELREGGSRLKKLRLDLEAVQTQKFAIQEELAIIRGQLKVKGIAEQGGFLRNWEEFKQRFHEAYQRFLKLLDNFNPAEAMEVKALFAKVSKLLEAGESNTSTGLAQKEQKLLQDLEGLFSKIKKLEDDLAKYATSEEEVRQQLFVKEKLLRNKQETLVKTSEQKNLLAVEQAKILTRKEALEQEAQTELGPQFREKLAAAGMGAAASGLQEKILKLKKQLSQIGGVDELTLQEYRETEERYQYLSFQSADLEKGVKDLKTVISELDEVIKKEFNEAYTKIAEEFAEYFRILFNGGRATMTILREKISPLPTSPTGGEEKDNDDFPPLEGEGKGGVKSEITGIEIRATPPGKKLAGISALSGGERALTSIALLCAILATYPSPFVVLDEVDAALDEANSIRFGKILGTLAHETQFITITHNRETMRQSHTLYGVTMGEDGVSKILSLKLEQAAAYSTKS